MARLSLLGCWWSGLLAITARAGGCKVGVGDVLIGAPPWPRTTTGRQGKPCEGQAHRDDPPERDPVLLRHRLLRRRPPTASGNCLIDLLLSQRVQAERHPLPLRDLAVWRRTLLAVWSPPLRGRLRDEKLGPVIDKYLKGIAGVHRNRLRILRLIENLTLGTAAVGYRTVHARPVLPRPSAS